jgi:dUTP diphosphatase
VRIPVRLLHPLARLPWRAHEGDGGADLHSVEDVVIPPGERRDVGTGIALAIPPGYGGFVQPRSGLAFRHGISVVNAPGLIDSGYRGEIRVVLLNTDPDDEFVVEAGMRIAQLVIAPIATVRLVEVAELASTERGGRGFGSSAH